jgi:mannose-6-phosphate isomerase-like protein (cupin superfamily)
MTHLNSSATERAPETRQAVMTAAGEGEAYWFYGDLAIVRSPDGALPIIIEHQVGSGGAAPLHVHTGVDDSFFLVSGELALRCGEQTFVARAGDYVSLPKGVPHTLRVISAEMAVLLQTHDGPDFLNFIRAVGAAASMPRPDLAAMNFETMNAVAAETGQPVLGPLMSADEAKRSPQRRERCQSTVPCPMLTAIRMEW